MDYRDHASNTEFLDSLHSHDGLTHTRAIAINRLMDIVWNAPHRTELLDEAVDIARSFTTPEDRAAARQRIHRTTGA